MASQFQKLTVLFLLLIASSAGAQDEQKENKVDTDVKELSGISIIGNKEAPKSLYIVPWKSSEVGVESGLSSSLLDPRLQPLDKEVFSRELEFYQLSLTDD
ncbi:hypothetical protein PVT68_16375 [Microbulbifer bruguierae]|uniref:Uncharacterized protein n=1 Tax=Microbulbifer bruguierae TaxID=3029061 RepID=A0ABY8NCK5_9GAMM|nr:hypothetical protein [Microbulbifer bruguierae]WGL16332.1 hypothetical protein PVT68_16375 [Microbulbifer bruguierae]